MRVGYLLAGFFFLFNPFYNVIDVLPDFIGYAFILCALAKLTILDPTLEEARRGFKNLLVVSLARFFSIFVLLMMQHTWRMEYDSGWQLVLVFSFFILDLWFSFKAFLPFFEGLDNAAICYGENFSDKKRANTVSMTYLFLIVKEVFCLLPELTYLWETSKSGGVSDTSAMTAANYRSLFSVGNIFVTTILGLIWFVLICSYLSDFRKPAFCEAVQAAYAQKLADSNGIVGHKRLSAAVRLVSVGTFFMSSLWINNINIIPDVLFAVFDFCALVILGNSFLSVPGNGKAAPLLAPCRSLTLARVFGGLFGIFALAQQLLSIIFYARYHTAESSQAFTEVIEVILYRSNTAMILYVMTVIFAVIEAVLFILFCAKLFSVLRKTAQVYTAKSNCGSTQLSGVNDAVYHEICMRFRPAFICAVLLAVSMIAYQALLFVLSTVWLIPFIVSIFFVAFTLRALSFLAQEIDNKFLYE